MSEDEILNVLISRKQELEKQLANYIKMEEDIKMGMEKVNEKINATERAIMFHKNPELIGAKVINLQADETRNPPSTS